MSWVRFDDAMADHPKVIGLSDAAFRLWIRAVCWSNRYQTDGVLPRDLVRELGTMRAAGQLVTAGLWTVDPAGGFRIHDFLDYQLSRQEVIDRREHVHAVRSAAGRLGAAARYNKRPPPARPGVVAPPDRGGLVHAGNIFAGVLENLPPPPPEPTGRRARPERTRTDDK